MPKNNNQTIMKSNVRSKSTARKPLRDVSNAGKLSSKSTAMKVPKPYKEEEQGAKPGEENGALDRLLLIHSDLSSLINQIDELVVQTLSLTSRKATKEVESFSNFLSEMQSSLKPWIPRFQKALFDLSSGPESLLEQSVIGGEIAYKDEIVNHVDSPEHNTMISLVSPSPLVSWRADCNVERGRQLFLLTPLPRSKELSFEYDEKSKSLLKNVTSRKSIQAPIIFDAVGQTNDNFLEGFSAKPTLRKTSDCNLETSVSPENFWKTDSWMLGMTPCLKISPPKSCVLLEPISEITKKGGQAVYKSTPFPVGVEISEGSEDSESSSSKVSKHTSVKYTDFLGIKFGQDYVSRRKVVEESPNWLMSPPKSCILMEPPDDKILSNSHINGPLTKGAFIQHKEKNLLSERENDVQGDLFTKITCRQAGIGTSSVMVECTPIVKEPQSTIQRGKHPGENTLKKELWTKFEAASTNGIGFSVSFLPKTTQKGFLDRLDEVS